MNITPNKYYRLLHPRPVYIIGSGSFDNNEINFMAASWVSPVSENPQIVSFACDKDQYTYDLIEKYNQFSINITNNIELIWKVGTTSGRNINKINEFRIPINKGRKLDVPILNDRLGHLETEVVNKIDLGDQVLYLSRVVYFEGKNIDYYGWKEFWKIPLHKGGKAFVYPQKKLIFPR